MTTFNSAMPAITNNHRSSGHFGELLWILAIIPLWVAAAATSSANIANAAAILGFVISSGLLWSIIGNERRMIGFLSVSALVLCVMQNAAWLTATYVHYFELNLPIEPSLNFLGGSALSVGDYSLALVYCTCFSLFLGYLGSRSVVQRSESIVKAKLLELKSGTAPKLSLMLSLITIAELGLVASGVIGQRSIVVEGLDDSKEPWWTFILNGLSIFQILTNSLTAVMLWKKRASSKYSRWIWVVLIISVGVNSFIFFNKGRRWLLFCILAHCWWFSFFSGVKPKFTHFAIFFLIGFPVVKEIMTFNNFLRSPALDLQNTKGSAIDVIPEALAKYQNYSDLQELAEEKSTNNLATRPLVSMPLAACMALLPKERDFVFETEIVNSFIWAMPRGVIKNKEDYPVQEKLLYNHFPIGYGDTADSLYLSSYISFGWLGVVIYPALMMIAWLAVIWMMRLPFISKWVVAIAIPSWFKFFASDIGEGSTGQMFVLMRATVVLVFTGFIFAVFRIGGNKTLSKNSPE